MNDRCIRVSWLDACKNEPGAGSDISIISSSTLIHGKRVSRDIRFLKGRWVIQNGTFAIIDALLCDFVLLQRKMKQTLGLLLACTCPDTYPGRLPLHIEHVSHASFSQWPWDYLEFTYTIPELRG